ncbi:MAG: hypothetical protein [Bacteriophage sp.]|nr:MAG: hypothetical protein [Bacteriophage sp.]
MFLDIPPSLFRHLIAEANKRNLPVKTMINLVLQGKIEILPLKTSDNKPD